MTSDPVNESQVQVIAENAISAWEKKRISVVIVVLAALGIETYFTATERTNEQIAGAVEDSIRSKVRNLAIPEILDPGPKLGELAAAIEGLRSEARELTKVSVDTSTPSVAPVVKQGMGGWCSFGIEESPA